MPIGPSSLADFSAGPALVQQPPPPPRLWLPHLNREPEGVLIARHLNEVNLATDYTSVVTAGGTVTEVTTRFHEGAKGLRINRTSAAEVSAYTFPGWANSRRNSGYFWLWVDSMPTGAATPIWHIVHAVGNNIEILLSPAGLVTCARQAGGTSSPPCPTSVTTGAWFRISWWLDTQGGTVLTGVAVNDDVPVAIGVWTQATENPTQLVYGSRATGGSALYDITIDDGAVYQGWLSPLPAPVAGGGGSYSQALDASGSAAPALLRRPGPVLQAIGGGGTLPAFGATALLDDFNRANTGPPPGPGWTSDMLAFGANEVGLKVQSNELRAIAAVSYPPQIASAWWSAALASADQEVYLTQTSGADFASHKLWARVSNPGTSGVAGYCASFYHNTGVIQKYVSGAWTDLKAPFSTSFTNVATGMGMRVVGSTIEVYAKQPAGSWTLIDSVVDTSITAGAYLGFCTFDSNLVYDDFGGGVVAAVGGGAAAPAMQRSPLVRRSATGGSAPATVRRAATVRSLTAATAPALLRRPSSTLQSSAGGSVSVVPLVPLAGLVLTAAGAVAAVFVRRPASSRSLSAGAAPLFVRDVRMVKQRAGLTAPVFVKQPSKVVQASGAGTPSVLLGMLRTWLLSATGGGLPSFVRDVRMVKQRAGLTAPVFVKRAARPVSVPASALATLVRQPAGRLQAVCSGVAVVVKVPRRTIAASGTGLAQAASSRVKALIATGSAVVSFAFNAIVPPILDFFSSSLARGNSAASSPDVTEMGATDPRPQVLSGPDLRDFDPPNPGAAP